MLAQLLELHSLLTLIVTVAVIAFLATAFFLIDWVADSWQKSHVSVIDWTEARGEGDEH